MSNNRITPFIKRMRTNGGTIYTFSSAVEDIGLNINERNNVVKISHFALLDIPQINFDSGDLTRNFFNIKAIDGAFEYEAPSASTKDGRVLIAESFQNYALNFESNLLNQSTYDPTLIRTVSERVFWKWMKETGAIRFQPDVSTATKQYWSEEIDADGSLGYNSVVKYVGPVSAGNVRTDTFGTYNETYVLVPTSHGQTDAYFEIIDDANYKHEMEIGDLGEKILGREDYTLPHPDGLSYNAYYDFVDSSAGGVYPIAGSYALQYDNSTGVFSDGWWFTADGREPSSTDNAYLTDSSSYQTTGIYNVDLQYTGGSDDFTFRRSKVDCLSLVSSLEDLKTIYGDTELTYDKMAIEYSINDAFNFNAVLIYYTVYNSSGEDVLGRNLLGVLFIDAPSGNSTQIGGTGITIPSLEKIQSGPGGFGTSYSLRLNIKTDNMVDDTGATIVDQSTSDQVDAENWVEAFANLNTAVNLLTQNTSVIQYLSDQYIKVQSTQTQILNDIQALQYQVNDIGTDIQGVANTVAMFADGEDPLVESSIYMKFGNVGIQTDDPQYPLEISGTTKTDEIIIENAIKDTSGNILLGYGSPLQLGSSTNYRDVAIYTGGNNPIVYIDSSGSIEMDADVSISGNLQIGGDSVFLGSTTFDGSLSSNVFDFDKSYLGDSSIGTGFSWINGYLILDASAVGVNVLSQLGDVSVNNIGSAQDGSALIWSAGSSKWTYGSIASSGGTGDVAWASGNDGNSTQLITANGDGSIVSQPNLTFDGTTLDVSSNITVSGSDPTISAERDKGLKINGGDYSTQAFGGDILITPGYGGSKGGNLKLCGGLGDGSGGDVSIYGGIGNSGGGGNVYIDRGLGDSADGDIIIGGTNGIPTGTPGSNQVLYVDTTDGYKLRRGTISGSISWSGSTTNGIATYGSSNTIVAESNLTYDGTALTLINNGANIRIGTNATAGGWLGFGDMEGSKPYVYLEEDVDDGLLIYASPDSARPIKIVADTLDVSTSSLKIKGTTSIYSGTTEKIRFTSSSGQIDADGDVIAYSAIVSDIRLKENIEPLENSLDKILQLEGISYDRKTNGDHHIGFIAQEVEKIIPEVIAETPLPLETGDEETIYKTIRYTELIPYLVESIKELKAEIEELKKSR